jgi:hypothetical protein
MDSRPGNGFPFRRWRVTLALAELPDGVVEKTGYLSWHCRYYGNVPPRQVLKKVLGTPVLVVNSAAVWETL